MGLRCKSIHSQHSKTAKANAEWKSKPVKRGETVQLWPGVLHHLEFLDSFKKKNIHLKKKKTI